MIKVTSAALEWSVLVEISERRDQQATKEIQDPRVLLVSVDLQVMQVCEVHQVSWDPVALRASREMKGSKVVWEFRACLESLEALDLLARTAMLALLERMAQ